MSPSEAEVKVFSVHELRAARINATGDRQEKTRLEERRAKILGRVRRKRPQTRVSGCSDVQASFAVVNSLVVWCAREPCNDHVHDNVVRSPLPNKCLHTVRGHVLVSSYFQDSPPTMSDQSQFG